MLKIRRIVSTLSAAAILISGLVYVAPDNAWARGGGGRGGGRVSVRGYYRSNGTYVRPYTRSAPTGSYGTPYYAPVTVTVLTVLLILPVAVTVLIPTHLQNRDTRLKGLVLHMARICL